MKIKVPLIALSAFFILAATPSAETEWIIELQGSDDLNSWRVLPMNAETLQDGRVRVQEGGGTSGFFRIHLRKPEDVASEKILAYIAAEGIVVPSPTQQDYLDLAVGEVNPGDLAELNSHLLEFPGQPGELPAFIEAKIELLSLDPVALAYAERTGLAGEQLARLSAFISEIKNAGINPTWLVLGRSEYKSRDGGTYRSVIGPDGTVVGTVTDGVGGMGFEGNGRVDFPNPLKTAALDNLYVMCHAGSDEAMLSGSAKTVASGYAGTSDRGFDMGYVAAAGLGGADNIFAMSTSPDNASLVPRASVFEQHVPGVKKFSGMVFSGTDPAAIVTRNMGDANSATSIVVKDLWVANPNNTHTTIYNDGATWSVGSRPGGASAFTGEVDLVLAGSHPLTEVQRDKLHGAALRNGLIETSKELMLIVIGDSMSDGQSGGVPLTSARTHQIAHLLDSGWRGGLYTQIAQSGQPVGIQESFWERAAGRFDAFPESVDKWVFFWGGYNSQAFDFSTEAGRAVLIERYIAMALDAEARGVRSVHWALTISSNATPAEVIERNLFSDEYAARCAAEGFVFYDHRLTFDQSEFDGPTRNEAYFVDTVHLSALGQETLCKDFVARFPGPDIDLDPDAANYIARIVQKGANPTTEQKLTINDWYVAEKAAGTYPSLELVYLPVWDVEAANRVNMITGQVVTAPDNEDSHLLSELAQATLVADFVSRFPGLSAPMSESP